MSSGISGFDLLVVDAYPLFGHGLALLLEALAGTQVRVVTSTANPASAEHLLRRHRPDLALVDLAMPPPGGLALIGNAKRAHPPLRVLALAAAAPGDDLEEAAVEALGAGADGFVPKSAQPEQLVSAVLAVARGYRVVPCTVAERLLATASEPVRAATGPDLDEDQTALWRSVARGDSNGDIAQRLFVSERTAKRLVAGLLRDLGVRTRLEAAALAGRAGLLEGERAPTRRAGPGLSSVPGVPSPSRRRSA